MLHKPYYNPKKSYEENYNKGPYGSFADRKKFRQTGTPEYDFFGYPVYLPFGIPASPVLNSKFVKGAFNNGFDLVIYKTVRSNIYPCHPHPNILHVKVKGNLTLKKAQRPLVADTKYTEPISITNSFGVPSKKAVIWQKDVKKAISYEGKGQLMILSFMGTVRANQTEKQFITDFTLAAKQSLKTGAKVLEVNLSCPNIGNEGLVCYNLKATEKVLKAIRKVIGKKPLIVKSGYFENQAKLNKFARIVDRYANGLAAINTIAAPVVDQKGKQALPGSPVRLKSGICGAAIRWAGLGMVKRLKELKKKHHFKFKIIGVGGVTRKEDYFKYLKAGADAVMSATGSMWNPYLAQQIKRYEKRH